MGPLGLRVGFPSCCSCGGFPNPFCRNQLFPLGFQARCVSGFQNFKSPGPTKPPTTGLKLVVSQPSGRLVAFLGGLASGGVVDWSPDSLIAAMSCQKIWLSFLTGGKSELGPSWRFVVETLKPPKTHSTLRAFWTWLKTQVQVGTRLFRASPK